VAQAALIERHRATGRVVNGLVSGFGYTVPMGMAASIAHDSHHIIAVGTSREDMARAVNRLSEIDGGVSIWREGVELAHIALPVAGMMSDAPAPQVARAAAQVTEAMRACGCTLNNAFIQHTFLALVVIPELRLSDLGLVDVTTFRFTEVIA
jgi:adenine deaminase